jgi:penicillin amidase
VSQPATLADLVAALPDLTGALRVAGLGARVEVWRDAEGIPHVRAASARDAFVTQGLVHAQDRLWQMEYDRRRGQGRYAELAGPAAVAQDMLMRRLGLLASARADYAAVDDETRAMLDSFAAGVNAYLGWALAARRLPVELAQLGVEPEPWAPWDALLVFKVRHVEMGPWQAKLWRARLVERLGPEAAARLCPGTPTRPMLIVPPGVTYAGPPDDGLGAFTTGAAALGALADWGLGSNSWALHGSRTASGRPLVAGDPHRAVEVPNCYCQQHLGCPTFDAIGLSFPGVPGLSHFGHNQRVAWCVTHAMADYQDLYLERFEPGPDGTLRYRFRDEWRPAAAARETIRVRGGDPVGIEVIGTHHGPVILGEPRRGQGTVLRYSATAAPNRTFDAFVPMLRAGSAAELEAAMRPWVDPVNNLVLADVDGRIAYRTRGQVPVRAPANAWLPVPGWDGAHEWQGMIPFEEMPAFHDPAGGFIATANGRITGPEYPHYLGLDVAQDFRTRRLVERLRPLCEATAADMASIHADCVSLAAQELVAALGARLAGVRLADPRAARALERLLAWDGRMDVDAVEPALYTALRERLWRDLMTPLLGPLTVEAFAGTPRGGVAHMARLKGRLAGWIEAGDRALLPPGADWPGVLGAALGAAVVDLEAALGPGLDGWRWGRLHRTRPEHPLAAALPGAATLVPPAVPMSGDGDTVFQAGFVPGAGYALTLGSVARYVFDLGDWERSGWVVPHGTSGHAASPHHADQVEAWATCRLLPMRYDWARIEAEAETHQTLDPA